MLPATVSRRKCAVTETPARFKTARDSAPLQQHTLRWTTYYIHNQSYCPTRPGSQLDQYEVLRYRHDDNNTDLTLTTRIAFVARFMQRVAVNRVRVYLCSQLAS